MEIAVVGCGPAGQAASVLLARMGHRVRVFEQTPSPGPIGAGILLQPTGMAVLRRLGALEHVLAMGARVDRLRGVTKTGRVVMDLAYANLNAGAFGLGVHRGMLFTALQRLVMAERIEVIAGRRMVRIVGEGRARPVLRDDGGGEAGPFDLVVAADGARSALREQLGIVERASPYPWGALWVVAEDAEGRYAGALRQVYHGTTQMIGTVPVGRPHLDAAPMVSLFWSLRADALACVRSAGVDAWKRQVRGLTRDVDSILDQVESMDQLIYAGYWDVVVRPVYRGRVVCIGDAAHATSPQLGQGANLALVDAAALADALGGEESVEAALAAFERARRRHIGFYSLASRALTPLFQSSDEWLGGPRDLLGGAACRVPWVRRQMLLSLAGVKTGLLREAALPTIAGGPGPVRVAGAAI